MPNVKSETRRAKDYIIEHGFSVTPDDIKEHLHLSISAATLGRKLRAAASGPKPELLKDYYISERTGRRIATYRANYALCRE